LSKCGCAGELVFNIAALGEESKELSSGQVPECYSNLENHTEVRGGLETVFSAVLCHLKSCIPNFSFSVCFFFLNLLISKKVWAFSP